MPEFVPTIALVTLVTTAINLLRYARGADWNGVATIIAAWVAGVIAVMIAAQTDFASGIAVGDRTLEGLNAWSQVFIGLSVASAGSFLTDLKKAVDNTDSAAKPRLLSPARRTPDPHGGMDR